jgi:membrane protein YqaA with SNARE-associated domain
MWVVAVASMLVYVVRCGLGDWAVTFLTETKGAGIGLASVTSGLLELMGIPGTLLAGYLADRFFQRWGNLAVFASRLLPVVRTFISLPAGLSRMRIWQFTGYTFAGSFVWSLALATAGYKLGENWEDLRTWMRPADIPIIIVVGALFIWYVYRHIKRAWADEPGAGLGQP